MITIINIVNWQAADWIWRRRSFSTDAITAFRATSSGANSADCRKSAASRSWVTSSTPLPSRRWRASTTTSATSTSSPEVWPKRPIRAPSSVARSVASSAASFTTCVVAIVTGTRTSYRRPHSLKVMTCNHITLTDRVTKFRSIKSLRKNPFSFRNHK